MTAIPVFLERGSTLVFFAVAALLVATLTALSADAARRAGLGRSGLVRAPATVAVFLACWFGLALVTKDSLPLLAQELQLPLALAVGFGPMLAAAAILFSSRSLRAVNGAMPGAWLVWAQSYRMAGFLFLFPFLAYGVIPAAFAIPAAVGDMITGALALPVGRAVARGGPQAAKWAVAWNVFGIVDLIVAPAAAIAWHVNLLGYAPLAILPLFLGPPLGILVHVFSLRNLAVNSHPAPARELALGTI